MKIRNRIKLIVLIGLTSLLSISSFAQEVKKKNSSFSVGVKGGMSFTSISYTEIGSISEKMNGHTGFNLGVAFKILLPVRGLMLQPEISYVSKGAEFRGAVDLDVNMGYIEVPLNIQYGLDLILFKPFVELSPYVAYAVSNSWETENLLLKEVTWNDINRLDYGLGIGAGVNFWKLQLKFRFSWSFVKLAKIQTRAGAIDPDSSEFTNQLNKASFRGLDVSLALFF